MELKELAKKLSASVAAALQKMANAGDVAAALTSAQTMLGELAAAVQSAGAVPDDMKAKLKDVMMLLADVAAYAGGEADPAEMAKPPMPEEEKPEDEMQEKHLLAAVDGEVAKAIAAKGLAGRRQMRGVAAFLASVEKAEKPTLGAFFAPATVAKTETQPPAPVPSPTEKSLADLTATLEKIGAPKQKRFHWGTDWSRSYAAKG